MSVIARTKIGPMDRCRGTQRPTRAAPLSGPQTTAWRPSVNRHARSGGGGHTIPSRGNPSARLFAGYHPPGARSGILGVAVIAKTEEPQRNEQNTSARAR
jgi:hypothetical protein